MRCLILLLLCGCSTVQNEFGADALLRKYEAFKNIYANLDAKDASIKVAEARVAAFERGYSGVPRTQWPRADLEQHNLLTSEVAGMKASFNSLAADYNARMVKDNYAFCNAGDLPKGAKIPLPRSFRPYEVK